jgi:hypothetical protein
MLTIEEIEVLCSQPCETSIFFLQGFSYHFNFINYSNSNHFLCAFDRAILESSKERNKKRLNFMFALDRKRTLAIIEI